MILTAPPNERLLERAQPSALEGKSGSTFVLLICFLLHAIPISLVIYGERSVNPPAAEQEIPVEIIMEPPPEEPPPTPPEEKHEKQPTLEETIATDSPRAPNDEKQLKDAKDDVSHAPKAAEGKAPTPAKADQAKPDQAKPAEAAPASDPGADGDHAVAAQAPQPDTSQPTKAQPAAPWEAQQKETQDPLAAFNTMPDYSFAPASKYPVSPGKAASTYVSIIYGLVLAQFHEPDSAADHVQRMGEINFVVDVGGRLLRQRIVKPSGSPELDAAAMAAIHAAGRFPPTPTGTILSLIFHYGK